MDEAAFDYADGLIRRADELIPGAAQANNLYYLKMLRDAIWKAARPDPCGALKTEAPANWVRRGFVFFDGTYRTYRTDRTDEDDEVIVSSSWR